MHTCIPFSPLVHQYTKQSSKGSVDYSPCRRSQKQKKKGGKRHLLQTEDPFVYLT